MSDEFSGVKTGIFHPVMWWSASDMTVLQYAIL